MKHTKKREITSKEDKSNILLPFLLSISITLASSSDNIAVYIAYFSQLDLAERFFVIMIFIIMQIIWTSLQILSLKLPFIHTFFKKYSKIFIPFIFILIGLWIISGIRR